MAKKTKPPASTKAIKAATTPPAPPASSKKSPAAKTSASPAKRKSSPKTRVLESTPIATVKPSPPNRAEVAASDSLQKRFASFDDAKSATIDALLEAIEEAESRLVDAKRAATFAQLERLANGRP